MMPLQIGTLCPNTSGMTDSVPTSFRSIIDLWRSREAMAAELGINDGSVVRKWFKRDTIPSEWWERLLTTETAKSAGLTAEILTRLAAKVSEEVPT
jgi:hypothetical protein